MKNFENRFHKHFPNPKAEQWGFFCFWSASEMLLVKFRFDIQHRVNGEGSEFAAGRAEAAEVVGFSSAGFYRRFLSLCITFGDTWWWTKKQDSSVTCASAFFGLQSMSTGSNKSVSVARFRLRIIWEWKWKQEERKNNIVCFLELQCLDVDLIISM